jgi:geranylgeranyl transferase type-1 subunit beta
MTYTALTTLRILGDDLSRVNKKAVIGGLKYLQQKNGSFCPTYRPGESDMRFVFCACAISELLGDWSGFDKELTLKYILDSQAYDGAFGMGPGLEGHGGSTYCAIASLVLMGKLSSIRNPKTLLHWCMINQGSGFQGRPNKEPDTCYSFWVGATLALIGGYGLSTPLGNREFNLKCQSRMGGFSKYPSSGYPDVLHAYYGLAGMSLYGADGVMPLDCALGISTRASGNSKRSLAALSERFPVEEISNAVKTASTNSAPTSGSSNSVSPTPASQKS